MTDGASGKGSRSSRLAGLPFVIAFNELQRDPQKLGILVACTIAAAATVFEPSYLSLSTSVIEAGLRAQDSPAPMLLAVTFLLLALMTMLAGASADIFGRRLFLLAGLVGLTVSNLLGMVWLDTPKLFVLSDALNALSGVLILPAAIAIIALTFGEGLRPIAYAILFTVQGTAIVVGMLLIPWLGGLWDGRATFIPVLVLCVLALWRVSRQVPESRAPKSVRRGSIVANFVIMAGVFVAIFLVVTGGIRAATTLLAMLVTLAVVVFAAILRWLAGRFRQFEGVEVFGGRDLGLAIFAGVMLTFAQGCFFFQITPFFYSVQDVGDLEGALRYVPYVIGLFAGGMFIPRLAARFGARRILVIAFVTIGVALLALSLVHADSPYWIMIVPIALVGLAGGLGGPARTTVVMSSTPEGMVNSSAAVNTAAGQIGYALGMISSCVLVTRYADRVFVDGLAATGVPADTVERISASLQSALARLTASRYPELPDKVKALTGVSYADAFTSGMVRMFFFVAIAMFITALVILIGMRRGLRATLAVEPASSQAETGEAV